MINWCKSCGELMLSPNSHKCPPAWWVWDADDGETREDACKYYGILPERAVEKWAENRDNQGDYTIVGGHTAVVCVVKDGKENPIKVEVTGETVPEYRARRLEQ
jgi:hypothetical protein